MKPNLTETVQSKQLKQKLSRDNEKSFRKFSEGDPVYIEDFSHAKSKWVSGAIQKSTGPVSYSVILSDGKIVRRHVDNIKARYNATTNETNGSEFDLAFQSEPEPTENTQHSSIPDQLTTLDDTTETTTMSTSRPSRINLLLDMMNLLLLMKPQNLKRRKCSNVTMNRLYYLMSVDVIVWLYDVIK